MIKILLIDILFLVTYLYISTAASKQASKLKFNKIRYDIFLEENLLIDLLQKKPIK